MNRRAFGLVSVVLGLILLGTGCVTSPGWAVANNTGFKVVVVQDGKIAANLNPGQTVALKGHWQEASLVTILAHDGEGTYIGANSYTYSRFAPYNWQVDHVFRPEGAR